MFSYKMSLEDINNLQEFLNRIELPASKAFDFVKIMNCLNVMSESSIVVVTFEQESMIQMEDFLNHVPLVGKEVGAFNKVLSCFNSDNREEVEDDAK